MGRHVRWGSAAWAAGLHRIPRKVSDEQHAPLGIVTGDADTADCELASWWKRKLWKLPMWVWVWIVVAILVVGGAVSAATKNKSAPAVSVTAPTGCSGVACQMTKDSGIYGIPYPADAVSTGPPSDLQVTSVGTLEEVSAYYDRYLTTHGWTFEPEFSTLDPAVAETKSLGHVSDGVYCKPTSPIVTVVVIVGNADSGSKVEIGLVDDQGESSCP